jgi:hypothetical protein
VPPKVRTLPPAFIFFLKIYKQLFDPVKMEEHKMIGRTGEYPEKVRKGELPRELERFRHTLQWPIGIRNIDFHLACYYEDVNYSNPRMDKRLHGGIDIQVPAGTEIRLPEKCRIFFCKPRAENLLANMIFWSEESKIEYWFGHMDPESIPPSILSRRNYNPKSKFQLRQGRVIGKVGFWPLELEEMVNVPGEVLPIFGRKFDHLHFEVRYVPANFNDPDELYDISSRAQPINPLLLLRNL